MDQQRQQQLRDALQGLRDGKPVGMESRTLLAYRFVAQRRANAVDFLSGEGARLRGARYTPKGAFRTFYGSSSPHTALAELEYYAQRADTQLWEFLPLVLGAVEYRLEKLLDLTLPDIQAALGISTTELHEEWQDRTEKESCLTQTLGRLANELGVEAFVAPSARYSGNNFVVFVENVEPAGVVLRSPFEETEE